MWRNNRTSRKCDVTHCAVAPGKCFTVCGLYLSDETSRVNCLQYTNRDQMKRSRWLNCFIMCDCWRWATTIRLKKSRSCDQLVSSYFCRYLHFPLLTFQMCKYPHSSFPDCSPSRLTYFRFLVVSPRLSLWILFLSLLLYLLLKKLFNNLLLNKKSTMEYPNHKAY